MRRPGSLEHFARTVLARAYPRVVGANREPSWVFFEIALPLLGTVALVLVYRSLGAPQEFEGYVIIGGAMTAFWLNTIWNMATQLRWEKEGGNLEIYLASPTHLMYILTGMAVGGSFSTSLRAVAVVALGTFAFSVPFQWSNLPQAFVVLLVTITSLYGVGMTLSSLFLKFGRDAEQGISTLAEPIYLFTGAYFPVRALGVGLAVAGSLIPMTLGMDALRQLLLAGDTMELIPWQVEVVILAFYTVLIFFVARWALARMERSAKRDGRLTLRWQ
ncbi:MAG TPA: ABC transporter permease [Acidimicrobiia bacterium]